MNPMKKILQSFLLTFCVVSASFAAQQTLTNSAGMLTKANQNFSELYVPVARTANEIAAGITPTTIGYQPGDMRRYGFVCLNATADTASGATFATANTTILNALGAATWADDTTLRFPPGICRFNDAVVMSSTRLSYDFDSRNQLHYYGTADKIALTIGNSTPSDHAPRTVIGGNGIMLINKTSNPYTNDSFVGLQLLGTFSRCRWTFQAIQGFTVGLQVRPSTSGFAYNTLNLGRFEDNKYHIDLHSFGAGEFINENLYLGGTFAQGTISSSIDMYGVRFINETGGYTGHNRNIFIKPSFELGNATGSTNRTPVLYDNNGQQNEFLQARVETGRGYVVDIRSTTAEVSRNLFEGAVQSGTWTTYLHETDGGLSYGNVLNDIIGGRQAQQPYWSSGFLPKKAAGTDTATVSVKGMFWQNTASSAVTYSGPGKVERDYLQIGLGGNNALGVEVDTSYFKSFLTRVSARTGFGGRVRFVCLNSSGVIQTSSDTGHPFVVGSSALTYESGFGGSYVTGSDGVSNLYFVVGSACAKTRVMVAGGTASINIKGFELYAFTNTAGRKPLIVTDGGLPQQPDSWYVNGNPATVLYSGLTARGQIFNNSTAALGQPPAYVATSQGYLARSWVASTTFHLGELVNNDTGKVYEQTFSPFCTSAGSGGPTGTGSAIADNTCTWDYVGTQATIAPLDSTYTTSLFSGTCDSTTFLRGDGSCNTPSGTGIAVGDTPTWTGVHTWSRVEPRLKLSDTGGGTNGKLFDIDVTPTLFSIRTRTDADGTGTDIFTATRTASSTALSNITLGYAVGGTYTFPFTGTATFSGGATINGTIQGGGTILGSASNPRYRLTETDAGTDLKTYQWDADNSHIKLRTMTDAAGTGKDIFDIARGPTTAIASISTGNGTDNPTFTTLGTGANTFNGSTVLLPNIASTSAAQQGTVCWATGGGLTVDTTVACLASTRKVKQNIQLLDIGLDQVMKLQPVSYDLKPEFNQAHLGPQVGLVAEDVQKVDPRLVALDDKGDPRGVRYMQLTAVLVKAIQQQQAEIAYLKWQVWGVVIAIIVVGLILWARRRRAAM